SIDALEKIVSIARSILFPGYFGNSAINSSTIKKHISRNVWELEELLTNQIFAGLCTTCDNYSEKNKTLAQTIAYQFIERLPDIRKALFTDVQATYENDPAAKSSMEIIFCYPAIRAISNYRIAHELLKLQVPIIPRIITEMAHSETGIDIHPGATIGNYFTIDHGTGVVIGETTIIGDHVKLYQGVTLGAKNFPIDENGKPIKGIPRHPIIEDNVIIYSNSTILGRITIGRNSVIGGNIWIDKDVPADSKIIQKNKQKISDGI
ncbi:MAG TPA: serine acetyltransferase, partial [Paludibacteraceae bacterium]|nr:serine acetyltransferase [Paludibacteraceae bacterium]